MKEITDIRKEIDDIDIEMKKLFFKRLNCSKEIALYKKEHNFPIYDKNREEQLITNLVSDIQDSNLKEFYLKYLHSLLEVSKSYQVYMNNSFSFLRLNKDKEILNDAVFSSLSKAQIDIKQNGKEKVNNATIGAFYNDEGQLICYDSYYKIFKNVSNFKHAKYADSFSGNKDFKEVMIKHFLPKKMCDKNYELFATPGGTGALALAFNNFNNIYDEIILPNIAWTSYYLMAKEYKLNIKLYNVFKENNFDIDDFKKQILSTLEKQNQVMVLINDPCQNPTGYSMEINEWNMVIDFLNSIPKNKKVILVNDIAYIDYSNSANYKDYMYLFERLNDNILPLIAFSCSKSFSIYGQRVGGTIFIYKDKTIIDEILNAYSRSARATYSNINNGAMCALVELLNNHKEEYEIELNKNKSLLKNRSKLFLDEAKKNNLPLYPYKDGFFISIKVNNKIIDKVYNRLMEKHVYIVKDKNSLRVGLCSLETNKCSITAKIISDTLKEFN